MVVDPGDRTADFKLGWKAQSECQRSWLASFLALESR